MSKKKEEVRKPEMKLTGVKSFTGREGLGMNAELHVDGVKTAYCIDSANGGGMNIDVYNNPEAKAKYKELEAYAASLPVDKGELCDMQPDVETLINELMDQMEQQKVFKRLSKQNIIWGIPGGENYTSWKLGMPLASYPKDQLQQRFDSAKAKLKPGMVFFNTNIAELGVKI